MSRARRTGRATFRYGGDHDRQDRPGRTGQCDPGAILTAAERLFAEHGVFAVSNRQVSEAAGQGNNAAVGYHFGTKADLVRAIVRKHAEQIERLRLRMVAEIGELRRRAGLGGLPGAPGHRASGRPGHPTWFARFGAQVMTDPALREIMVEESLTSPVAARDHRRAEPVPALAAGRGARRARATWPVS